MEKVIPDNGNETKSDIFPWDTFKPDSIYFYLSEYYKVIEWLSKSEFLSFFTKMKPKNWNETKSDIFPWDIFKSNTFIYPNILKYISDLQNRNFSILLLKSIQAIKMKQN